MRGKLIKRFTADELKPLFDGTPEFSAMTTDLDGHLYLADAVTNQVTILDWRKLERIGRFGALGQARAQYLNIAQLSVNSHGQIAVLDSKNKKVEVFQLEQQEFKTPVLRDLVKIGAVQDSKCTSIQAFVDAKLLCIKPKKGGIAYVPGLA